MAQIGAILAQLGAILAQLGAMLAQLGAISAPSWPSLADFSSTWRLKRDKTPSIAISRSVFEALRSQYRDRPFARSFALSFVRSLVPSLVRSFSRSFARSGRKGKLSEAPVLV